MGGFASIPASWAAIASMKSKSAIDGLIRELDGVPQATRKVASTLGQYARDNLSEVSGCALFPAVRDGETGA